MKHIAKLRVDGAGIFVPRSAGFVEERGIFVARPNAVLPGQGADPSFTPVRRCIYTYRIKG